MNMLLFRGKGSPWAIKALAIMQELASAVVGHFDRGATRVDVICARYFGYTSIGAAEETTASQTGKGVYSENDN